MPPKKREIIPANKKKTASEERCFRKLICWFASISVFVKYFDPEELTIFKMVLCCLETIRISSFKQSKQVLIIVIFNQQDKKG